MGDGDRRDPTLAADDLWERLHRYFSEAQLVELGHFIALTLGQQRFLKTLDIRHGEVLADTEPASLPMRRSGSAPPPAAVNGRPSQAAMPSL